MVRSPEDIKHWALDKRVPVALLVVLLGQLATGVWFASRLMHNDSIQDDNLSKHDRRIEAIEQSNTAGRLAVLEAQMTDIRALAAESNRKLDKIIDRQLNNRP